VTGHCAAMSPGPRAHAPADQRPHPLIWALPVLALAIAPLFLVLALPPALFHLPDAYLTLVRLTVSLCAALAAHASWRKGVAWSLAFIAVGLLYNPVLTIHMAPAAWAIAHVGTLLIFALHWFSLGAKLSLGAGEDHARVSRASGQEP
jgi:hypothetical protein